MYPGGILNRFLDTDVIVGDAVAYIGDNCAGVPTDRNTIGCGNCVGIGIDPVPADVVLGAIGWELTSTVANAAALLSAAAVDSG